MLSKKAVLSYVSLIFLSASFLCAQTSRGTVSGIVADPQKASIPGARVDLTGEGTNVTRSTETNESGLYRFDAVEPGVYTISVKATGMKGYTATNMSVGAAEVVTHDVNMQIGDVAQTVEVTEQAVALRADSPVRGANIDSAAIVDLPYATRNPADLALTVPGVITNKYNFSSGSFAVNGTRGRSNNFMIDGTDNNDISVGGQAFTIKNPGSIVETSIQTTNFDSEFGRAGGAVINLVTKSGTNQFHGTAGMVLDSTWDDAIPSSLAKDPTILARGHNFAGTDQQFDGTLGGPIIRNKTFFHLSYLEQRQFSTSTTEMVTPTAAGRATLLSLFPKGTNANADLLQQITSGFDGQIKAFNVPLGAGRPDVQFGSLITPYAQSLRVRQYGAKIDHSLGAKDSLSGRFLIDDQLLPRGGEVASFPSFDTGATQYTLSISLYETHVFSPSFTNEFRPGYTRVKLDFPIDATNPLAPTLPQIAIQGINTTSTSVYGVESAFPQGRVFNDYVIQDTASIVHGKHTFRFGADLTDQRARQAAPFNSRGTLSYGASSGAQAFSGLANFLDNFGGAGSVTKTFGSANYYPNLFRQGYFMVDKWRMTPSVTLSLGLRYEYFGTPMNVILNPVFTGLFNVNPTNLDSPLFHANKVPGDKNNFAPSVGLAYSPSFTSDLLGKLLGDRKSVIRMGYALGYDSYYNNITSNMVAGAPNAVGATVPSTISTATPRGVANFSTMLPTTPPALTPILSQTSVSANLVNPYYQHWSAGIQRELPSAMLLDVSYVGSKGTRLFVTEDLNPLVPANLRGAVPANLTPSAPALQLRLDPLQGARTVRTNGGSSSYHSLQVQVSRRFSSGVGFSAAYTYSKAIDNGSEIFSRGNTSILQNNSVPSLYGGLQIDRAISSIDHPQRAVFTFDYVLPLMKGQHGVAGRVLGGWQIIGIPTYELGTPYTVVNGQDADGLGGATYDRPNFNPNVKAKIRAVPNANSPTGYVNPDNNNAPIDPSTARYIAIAANTGPNRLPAGNLGRNTERSPGLKNWDINIVKTTRISERVSVELRGEFFNIWNTPMYGIVSVSPFAPPQSGQGIPANTTSSPSGQFLNPTVADGGGRVIRYQLRFHF